jgi:hypothetical protein
LIKRGLVWRLYKTDPFPPQGSLSRPKWQPVRSWGTRRINRHSADLDAESTLNSLQVGNRILCELTAHARIDDRRVPAAFRGFWQSPAA